jgi:hypothetical protein
MFDLICGFCELWAQLCFWTSGLHTRTNLELFKNCWWVMWHGGENTFWASGLHIGWKQESDGLSLSGEYCRRVLVWVVGPGEVWTRGCSQTSQEHNLCTHKQLSLYGNTGTYKSRRILRVLLLVEIPQSTQRSKKKVVYVGFLKTSVSCFKF